MKKEKETGRRKKVKLKESKKKKRQNSIEKIKLLIFKNEKQTENIDF